MRAHAVENHLESLSLTDAARVYEPLAQHREHATRALDGAHVAADERDEIARTGGSDGATDGRVEEPRAVFFDPSTCCDRRLASDRRHIDDDGARPATFGNQRRENPIASF